MNGQDVVGSARCGSPLVDAFDDGDSFLVAFTLDGSKATALPDVPCPTSARWRLGLSAIVAVAAGVVASKPRRPEAAPAEA